MTPEQKDLLNRLFDEASALPASARDAYLASNCTDPEVLAEVRSLLQFAGTVEGPGITGIIGEMMVRTSGIEAPGSQVGPYVLGEILGEGGMGTVYRAEQQQPIRRSVALKIVKPGMDSRQVIARFESERQSLAMMDHPNIARVYDAGATLAGRPYFAMELVDGIAITRYCDLHRLNPRARLELFIPVCEAIQHAHQKGILHRDIKPSNVLVAEVDGKATPKVIDFGIAKAMTPVLNEATATMLTSVGTVVGTLDYMSPEQANVGSADIDTRSDVYSLGVLLYELLTGGTPISRAEAETATYLELLRRIREDDPAPPSARLKNATATLSEVSASRSTDPGRLPKLVHGELDWIVMKALEKDRDRRYQTANGLVRDIERYLNGEPVEAGPPSARYRLIKMARKHRAALGTVAAFLVMLAAATGISTWEAIRARRAEQVAEAVNSFLLSDLLAQASVTKQANQHEKADPDVKVRTLLDRASKTIPDKFPGQPEVEAAIRATISDSYVSLGLEAAAKPHAERAVALRMQTAGPEARETINSMTRLGMVLYGLAKYDEATALQEKVVGIAERKLGPDDDDTLEATMNLAQTYDAYAKFAEAESIDRKLVDIMTRRYHVEDERTLNAMEQLANNLTRQAKYGEAVKIQKQALEVERRALGPEHPQTLNTMNNLAVANYYYGDYAEAERLYHEVLPQLARIQGPEHARTISTMTNLSVLQGMLGEFAEARANQEKILEIFRRTQGPQHLLTSVAMHNLANTLLMQGDYAGAEKLLTESLKIRAAALGEKNPETLKTRDFFGTLRRGQKRLKEAEAVHREVLEAERKSPGPNHPNTFLTMTLLANVLADQGRYAEAEAVDREALAGLRKVLSPLHLRTLKATNHLAFVLEQQGRNADAEALLRPALEQFQKTLPDNWHLFQCRQLLGASLAGQNKLAEAKPLVHAGYSGMLARRATIPADSLVFLNSAAEWDAKLAK